MDRELVAGLNPESGGHWFSVWMEVSDGCPSGLSVGNTGAWQSVHAPIMCPCSPDSQLYPGLLQKRHGNQGKGGDPAPLHCTGEVSPGVLHPDVESSVQERHGPGWSASREGPLK